MKNLIHKWNNISLIKRIICGLIIGIALGLIFPQRPQSPFLEICSSEHFAESHRFLYSS